MTIDSLMAYQPGPPTFSSIGFTSGSPRRRRSTMPNSAACNSPMPRRPHGDPSAGDHQQQRGQRRLDRQQYRKVIPPAGGADAAEEVGVVAAEVVLHQVAQTFEKQRQLAEEVDAVDDGERSEQRDDA